MHRSPIYVILLEKDDKYSMQLQPITSSDWGNKYALEDISKTKYAPKDISKNLKHYI